MRIALNLALILIIALLVYVLMGSIREPIAFQKERNKREAAVVEKLITVRKAQECYRFITGEFAPNFDTLAQVLKTGKFALISVIGDPDDPLNPVVTYDTLFKSALDSMRTLALNPDSLKYVPYGGGAAFDIQADTLTYQSTMVQVIQVGTPRKTFMGAYGDIKFAKYDNSYDPNSIIKFGNMNAPNTSGNWER